MTKRALIPSVFRFVVSACLCVAPVATLHAQTYETQLVWNFHADIGGKTCTVETPPTVRLPHIQADALAAPNASAGDVKVSVKVTNCDAAVDTAHFTFIQNPDLQKPQYFRIDQSSTAARGVAFRLTATDGTLIQADGTTNTTDIPVTGGQGELDLMIGYVHTMGTVTPGDVDGRIEFDVDYP